VKVSILVRWRGGEVVIPFSPPHHPTTRSPCPPPGVRSYIDRFDIPRRDTAGVRGSDPTMGMQCDVCGKKPVLGNQKTYRGKAKYLGGVGKKITGTSRRTFYPNLQAIRVVRNGKTVRASVCVQCIRSGKVQRPVKRKPMSAPQV